ncbi:MAG: HAD hydrolase family protein, partial [Rhodothermales bacterium]|nr:HAD hydrolase family protein [Rhodothermales bacterium]
MIRLFVSDIDGCLAEPYRPFDLDRLRQLAALVEEAGPFGGQDGAPAFSICSGRPYPYVEAMTQVLGVRTPVLFESGGGLFDPESARVCWHPAFTPTVERAVGTLRAWMRDELIPGTTMMLDHAKRTQAGVIGPDPAEVEALLPTVRRFVADRFPAFSVFSTPVSIDAVPASITKREGLAWLADRLGCPLDAVAFIGDTDGDLGALGAVGHAFAPANATGAVKAAAAHVTTGATLAGVLAAYR